MNAQTAAVTPDAWITTAIRILNDSTEPNYSKRINAADDALRRALDAPRPVITGQQVQAARYEADYGTNFNDEHAWCIAFLAALGFEVAP